MEILPRATQTLPHSDARGGARGGAGEAPQGDRGRARKAVRTVLWAALGTVVSVASCAPLLGLEVASCDPQDSSCDLITSVPSNNPSTGEAGRTIPGDSTAASNGNAGTGMGGTGGAGAMPMGGAGGVGMGGTGMGGMGMAGAPIPEEPPSDSSDECLQYCSDIQAVCNAASGFQQYATETVCLLYCELFEAGDPTNFAGTNTLACRRQEVESARDTGEVSEHCPSGGPGGNNVCGSNCEGFCTAMTVKCGQGVPTYERFADTADCLDLCAVVPELEQNYSIATQNEDSVQCRLYHVTAATLRPEAHCSHASGEELCIVGG